jgi:hypothetical protein
VNAHSLSSLSLDQWMTEFDPLKKLNKEILRPKAQKRPRQNAQRRSDSGAKR